MKEMGGVLFYFLYDIFIVKVQEIAWSASYDENKTQNPKRTNKGNIRHQKTLQLGSVLVPGPHTGTKLKQGSQRKPSPEPADSMKNKIINLALLRRHKVTKGDYIR